MGLGVRVRKILILTFAANLNTAALAHPVSDVLMQATGPELPWVPTSPPPKRETDYWSIIGRVYNPRRNQPSPAPVRNNSTLADKSTQASNLLRSIDEQVRDRKLYEKLKSLLDTAVPRSKWTPDYVTALTRFHLLLQQNEKAEELLDIYLPAHPTAELLLLKAIALQRKLNNQAALMFTTQALSLPAGQSNPEILRFHATLLETLGRSEEAWNTLLKLREKAPGNIAGTLQTADFLLNHARPEWAFEVLDPLLSNSSRLNASEHVVALQTAAQSLAAQSEWEKAKPLAESAWKLSNGNERWENEKLFFGILARIDASSAVYKPLRNALDEEANGNFALAESLAISAAEKDRGDPNPFLVLGRLYGEMGDVASALNRFQHALKDTRERPMSAALQIARIQLSHFENKESENALAEARKIVASTHQSEEELEYLQGILALQRRDKKSAETAFGNALTSSNRVPDVFITQGNLAAEDNDAALAEFYFSQVLRDDPRNLLAIRGLAEAKVRTGPPSHAIDFIKIRMKNDFSKTQMLVELGIIYQLMGDRKKSKELFLSAIRNDPNSPDAYFHLGQVTRDEGNFLTDLQTRRHAYRDALAAFEKYVSLSPRSSEGLRAIADLSFDIRDLGQASQYYSRLLAVMPHYPEARIRLAQIHRNASDNERALALLNEEIALHPWSDSALVERGNIFMAGKDFTAAEKSFTEAVRSNPKNADALFGLGVIHHLRGEFDNALAIFSKIIALDPLKSDLYWQMGLIYQKQRNFVKALQAFTNYRSIVREPAAQSKADEKICTIQQEFSWRNCDRAPATYIFSAADMLRARSHTMGTIFRRISNWRPATEAAQEHKLFEILDDRAAIAKKTTGLGIISSGKEFTRISSPLPEKMTYFTFPYIGAPLPEDWACEEDSTTKEWACRSKDENKKSLAILTMSYRDRTTALENLAKFNQRLQYPRMFESLQGDWVTSEVKFVRKVEIAGEKWIEAMHYQSEMPEFYTRYFVTNKNNQTILFSLSVRKDKLEELAPELDLIAGNFGAKNVSGKTEETTMNIPGPVPKSPSRTFESLPPEIRKEVEEDYGAVLDSYFRHDYKEMRDRIQSILTNVTDYRDIRFFSSLAERGLLEQAALNESLLQKTRSASRKNHVQALLSAHEADFKKALKNHRVPASLNWVAAEVLALDPENDRLVKWKAALNRAK